jgi:tetratricopeptide (TPR) repeat protein
MPTQDLHGLALSTSSAETARAFNHAVTGYLSYRADATTRLQQLIAADPEYAFAHLLKGYFLMLSFNAAHVPAAREAVALAPGDLWAAHGVAHVLEMQGRREEGLAWLAALEPHWQGGNNLTHHLWWHRALYHFERREFAQALDLYDRRFRNLAAPLTQAQPDLYIDVQNAASMLFRLERQGVDVGARWGELAEKAEDRIGDCLSVFTLPHWMMALTAAGRWETAGRTLEAMRAFAASGAGAAAGLVRDGALPIGEALVARASGEPGRACDLMRPALDGMYRMGR